MEKFAPFRDGRPLLNGQRSPEETGPPGCPFCSLEGREIVASNELAVAFQDGFPVNPGHTLVVPRRHVATWFDADREEQVDEHPNLS